jgi:hypothetical protein
MAFVAMLCLLLRYWMALLLRGFLRAQQSTGCFRFFFINSKEMSLHIGIPLVNSNCHLFILSLLYVRENQIESDRDAMFDGFYSIFDGT